MISNSNAFNDKNNMECDELFSWLIDQNGNEFKDGSTREQNENNN